MSNSIFDWPASLKRFVRFTTAKAEDVNDALDELSAGLDGLEGDIDRALKLPQGAADQTLALTAGQRAGKAVAFDAAGDVTAIVVASESSMQAAVAAAGDAVTQAGVASSQAILAGSHAQAAAAYAQQAASSASSVRPTPDYLLISQGVY